MAFLQTLQNIITKVTTALEGPIVPMAVSIAQDVLDLANEAKTIVKTDDLPTLQAMIDDLEPKVMAHADKTASTLRGS